MELVEGEQIIWQHSIQGFEAYKENEVPKK